MRCAQQFLFCLRVRSFTRRRVWAQLSAFATLAFSRDGATLAVVRDEGSTQLIDVINHKPIAYFIPDEHPAASIELLGAAQDASLDNHSAVSVVFNSSGSLLAAGARDGVVHIWVFPSGRWP